MNQLIISIGREFGSGGHVIAQKLSEHYDLSLYDHNIISGIILDSAPLQNSAAEFDYIREKAESGESFVIVGRCSETMLKGHGCLVSVFISGDMPAKKKRIMELYQLSPQDAQELIKSKDKERMSYHNSHCDNNWGDSRNYDLAINSSKLGMTETVKFIIQYIDARRRAM